MCSGKQHLEGGGKKTWAMGDDGIARSPARLMRDSRTGLHQSPLKLLLRVKPLYPALTSPWRPAGEEEGDVVTLSSWPQRRPVVEKISAIS